MILVIAGTSDSYQLLEALKKADKKVMATVTTDYGRKLIKEKFEMKVLKKRLNQKELLALIKKYKIKTVIDSTHPFAEIITKTAIEAAQKAGIKYIRFERKELDLNTFQKSGLKLIRVSNYEQAAEAAENFENIFLTIGSKNAEVFINKIPEFEKRLTVRVLAFPLMIKKLIKQGLSPANIVAAKGPFSLELNRALFKEYQADVIITKASGESGGLKRKIEAAAELNIAVIIIERPKFDYPFVFKDVEQLLQQLKS